MDKLKILIVEDDKQIHEFYDKGLPDDIFEKKIAENGKDGLKLYHAFKPDIILLDIMLPIMTGYVMLKEIRQNIGDKSTTIIMSTSYRNKEDMADCYKIGIQGYITKPFEIKEIGNLIIKYYQGNKK